MKRVVARLFDGVTGAVAATGRAIALPGNGGPSTPRFIPAIDGAAVNSPVHSLVCLPVLAPSSGSPSTSAAPPSRQPSNRGRTPTKRRAATQARGRRSASPRATTHRSDPATALRYARLSTADGQDAAGKPTLGDHQQPHQQQQQQQQPLDGHQRAARVVAVLQLVNVPDHLLESLVTAFSGGGGGAGDLFGDAPRQLCASLAEVLSRCTHSDGVAERARTTQELLEEVGCCWWCVVVCGCVAVCVWLCVVTQCAWWLADSSTTGSHGR